MLHDHAEPRADTLASHLELVDQKARRLSALRDRLVRLLAYLDEPFAADALVAMVEATTHMERYVSSRQLNRLAAQRAALGAAGQRGGAQPMVSVPSAISIGTGARPGACQTVGRAT